MSKTRHRPKTEFPRKQFERYADRHEITSQDARQKMKRLKKGKR